MRLSALFSLFILYVHFSYAQSCLTNSLIINTGFNPLTSTAITPGFNGGIPVPDPHWIVTSESPDIAAAIAVTPVTGLVEVTPGNNANIITLAPGWAINPIGNPGGWIGCLNSNEYVDPGDDTATYFCTLSRPFRMCSDDSIVITMHIANDNYIPSCDIDGTPLSFSQAAAAPVSNFEDYSDFTQTVFLTSGTHRINIVSYNFSYSSFYSANPTGIDIYGTVSSATGTNSLISESSTACLSYVCDVLPVCNTLYLPDTLYTCSGVSDTLSATVSGTDSILNISWSPSVGLSDTSILDPVLMTSSSGWYYLSIESLIPGNLVFNGDFSLGDTGFTSSYTYVSGAGSLVPAGVYAITTNPHLDHPSAGSFGDHTTGMGNMMAINGASTPISVWCETIHITPHTNYVFSSWFADWSSDTITNLPLIQFQINGSLLGSGPFTFPGTDGNWTEFYSTWNSGTDTTATICIYDEQTALSGNDFAIDDISFEPLCIATDSIYVAITPTDTTYLSTDTLICGTSTGGFLSGASGYPSYLWNTGATSSSIAITGSGTYWVTETNSCSAVEDTFNVTYQIKPSVNIGNDTTLCAGDSIMLYSPQPDGSTYLWSTGSMAYSVTAVDSGTYWLTVSYLGCSTTDSVTISINPDPVVNLGSDTFICAGQTIILQSSDIYTDPAYLWSTGATSSDISVNTSGDYWLQVTENNCTGADSVHVKVYNVPVVNLEPDTSICDGKTIEIGAPEPPGMNYSWSNGSIDSAIFVSDAGTFVLTVSDTGCIASDTIQVNIVLPPSVNLGPDTTICNGQTFTLITNTDGLVYEWSNGENGKNDVVSETGTYWVIVSNGCGTARDSVTVTVDLCDIWFPSAFTPNGDQLNDIARVVGTLKDFSNFSLSIYNRWGQRVFYSQDIYSGWDGTFNGVPQDLGTYFYMVHYSLEGQLHMLKGDLELIR